MAKNKNCYVQSPICRGGDCRGCLDAIALYGLHVAFFNDSGYLGKSPIVTFGEVDAIARGKESYRFGVANKTPIGKATKMKVYFKDPGDTLFKEVTLERKARGAKIRVVRDGEEVLTGAIEVFTPEEFCQNCHKWYASTTSKLLEVHIEGEVRYTYTPEETVNGA